MNSQDAPLHAGGADRPFARVTLATTDDSAVAPMKQARGHCARSAGSVCLDAGLLALLILGAGMVLDVPISALLRTALLVALAALLSSALRVGLCVGGSALVDHLQKRRVQ